MKINVWGSRLRRLGKYTCGAFNVGMYILCVAAAERILELQRDEASIALIVAYWVNGVLSGTVVLASARCEQEDLREVIHWTGTAFGTQACVWIAALLVQATRILPIDG